MNSYPANTEIEINNSIVINQSKRNPNRNRGDVKNQQKRYILRNKELERFKCYDCNKAFVNGDTLKNHYNTNIHKNIHKNRLLETKHCDICDHKFATKQALINHFETKKHIKLLKLKLEEESKLEVIN